MGEAPDPILPGQNAWAVACLIAIVLVTIFTVVHALKWHRFGWTAAIIFAVPLALPAYWMVEVLRVRRPTSRAETTSSPL